MMNVWNILILSTLIAFDVYADDIRGFDNTGDSQQILVATHNDDALLQRCWSERSMRQEMPGDRIRKLSIPEPGTMDPGLVAEVQELHPDPDAQHGSIRSVNITNNAKPIALTFDLCEQADEESGYDSTIVNYLRDYNIKATFYAGGKWMQTHPERTKQLMLDPRFEIGNHGWTHGNLRVMTGQRMRNQILWTQAQYYKIRQQLVSMDCVDGNAEQRIPLLPATFRYPYGTCSVESLDTLQGLGLPAIQWSIVTSDPVRAQSAQGIAKIVLSRARPGAIIIAHANRRGYNTAKALPLFIPQLQALGYEFVTVSELLAMGKPVAADTCYELRVGDNVRYDRLFGEGTGERRAPNASSPVPHHASPAPRNFTTRINDNDVSHSRSDRYQTPTNMRFRRERATQDNAHAEQSNSPSPSLRACENGTDSGCGYIRAQ